MHDEDERRALERDILAGRTFSVAEAIGREGSDFMKGESPVPRLMQVRTELTLFINQNLPDASGALQAILGLWVRSDEVYVSRHIETPLRALHDLVESILNNSHVFYEFVRQVDVKWGQMNDERPFFQQPGQAPHPDDEYTHDSVRIQLESLLHLLPPME